MTVVPITSPDLDAVEVSFSAPCSDDYDFWAPDGSPRSSWDLQHYCKTAEEHGFAIFCALHPIRWAKIR